MALHAQHLVLRVALGGAAGPRQVTELVSPVCVLFDVPVEPVDVPPVVHHVLSVPRPLRGLRVEENLVADPAVLFSPLRPVVMAARALPRDLAAETLRAEDRIEDDLHVMRDRPVAVQVETPGRLQEPVHRLDPLGHVRQVGQHPRLAEDPRQADDRAVRRPSCGRLVAGEALAGGRVPGPGVDEGPRLRATRAVAGVQDVVVRVAVERGVEVDQVDGGVVPPAHPVETVAVAEGVGRRRWHPGR